MKPLTNTPLSRRRWLVSLLAWLIVASVSSRAAATVQRRITVRTNPPGAQCYIDDYEIGITPCSTDFVYYGTRKIRLVKDGYETLTVEQRIRPPWFEWFPVDFVTENLYPGELRDEQVLEYRLTPQRIMASVEVLERAENLRRSHRIEGLNPPADAVGGGTPASPLPAAPPRPRNVPGYMLPGYTNPRQPGPSTGYTPRSAPAPISGAPPVDPFAPPPPPALLAPPATPQAGLVPPSQNLGAPAVLPPAYTLPPQGTAVPIFDPPGSR